MYSLQLSVCYLHPESSSEIFMYPLHALRSCTQNISPARIYHSRTGVEPWNRRPTRYAHANGHAEGAVTSAGGTGVIESPLKGE